MKTHMECRSLGEEKGNYINANIRQIKQKQTSSAPTTKRSHSSGGDTGKVATSLLVGAGVGVLAGMLLAPEKGKVLRRQVADSASKVGDQVSKGFNTTKEKVSSWTGKGDAHTDAHVNEAPSLPPTPAGNVHKSPYTDENKWSDQEVKNMTDTARKTPGV